MSRFYNRRREIIVSTAANPAQGLPPVSLKEGDMFRKTNAINRLSAGIAAIVIVGSSFTVFGQGPLQKRLDFSINVPYTLRMGDYLLPAGHYVLHQVLQNDLNLFALHPGDMTHKPVALIRTTRIDYNATGYPGKTSLLIDTENNGANYPKLEGWNIPGLDGFEIITVVEKKRGALANVTASVYRDRH